MMPTSRYYDAGIALKQCAYANSICSHQQCRSSYTQPEPKQQVGDLQVSTVTRSLQKLSGEVLEKAELSQIMEFQEVLRQKLAEIEGFLKQNGITAPSLSQNHPLDTSESCN